jgi:Domain of unknown function (DUF5666)
MKRSSVILGVLGAVGLAGLLSACSDGSPSASASAGGASGSGSASASGTVTGFGSVIVNGKRFETNNVLVNVDGSGETSCTIGLPIPGLDDSCGIKKGMVVTVNGSFSGNQHTAASVRQKDAVEGLVQSVAPDRSSLVVMGQIVLIDSTTIIDNNITNRDLATLQVGTDHVEINGHVLLNGVIQATFIEKKLANVTPEVRGFVAGHNDGTKTFQIGNLTVDYSTTPPAGLRDMPNPAQTSWNSLFVEVKGANAAAFDLATVTLTASEVEPENQGIGNNVDEFEVEGFVTNVISVDTNTRAARFFIGTTEVHTTSNTEFREGTVDEIVLGAKMSAEGRLENGVLVAKHVKFKESARLEGDIDNLGQNSFTIKGLPGVVVMTNGQPRIDNGPLQVNHHVRVRGRLSDVDTVIATRIKVESSDNDVILQGQVQAKADPDLTILGVAVNTTGVQFEGVDDGPISRTAFFAALKVNETLVKVKGTLNGTTVTWDEAELED